MAAGSLVQYGFFCVQISLTDIYFLTDAKRRKPSKGKYNGGKGGNGTFSDAE